VYFTHVGTSFHVMPVHLFHAMSVRFGVQSNDVVNVN
jgi:hypothetical protein